MNTAKQYCSFYVGDLFLGVDVKVVQEMIRYQEMTCVPLAASELRGLINLRGQIVPAIDLRRRIKLDDRSNGELPMNVVVQTAGGVVSLLVDQIGDVLAVQETEFERTPDTITGVLKDLTMGVYKLEKQLFLIVDPDKAADLYASAA